MDFRNGVSKACAFKGVLAGAAAVLRIIVEFRAGVIFQKIGVCIGRSLYMVVYRAGI